MNCSLGGVMVKWKLMETAPKTGVSFLAYSEKMGHTVIWWDESEPHTHPWADGGDRNFHKDSFTHWMPLTVPDNQQSI